MRFLVAVVVVLASFILGSHGQFLNADCGTGSNSPWLVHIQAPIHSCGGSLITNRYVLTAAQCSSAQANELTIRVAGSTFNVVSVTKHPRYKLFNNDIALMKLERAVQFDDNIKPICVYSASNPQLKRLVESTQQLKLAYWKDGSDELKTGIVNRLRKQACTEAFHRQLGPDAICVQSSHYEIERGTAGSPLSILTNVGGHQRFVQVGIPSFGHPFNTGPSVYTDVLYFSAWIASVVRN